MKIFRRTWKTTTTALRTAVLFLTFVATVFACTDAEASDLTQIKEKGVLKAAVTDTHAYPFVTVNERGEYVGFEIELAQLFADKLGVRLELVPVRHFDDIVDKIVKREADVGMAQLSCTSERAEKVLFTNPYATLNYALLVKRIYFTRNRGDNSMENFVRNFRGTINVHGHTVHYRMLSKMFPNAQIIPVDTRGAEDALLASLRMEACFDDIISIRNLCNRNPSSSIHYQRVVLKDAVDTISIAVSPDCYHLAAWINGILEHNRTKIKQRIEHPEAKKVPFQ